MTDLDCYFVLTPEDVISHASAPLHGHMGCFVGHSLWATMPSAELIFRPYFQKARQTGREVEFTAFYAGGAIRMRVVPCGLSLTVHPTRLTQLNVRTLATLATSLQQIEAELAGRECGQLDPLAPASLQALP